MILIIFLQLNSLKLNIDPFLSYQNFSNQNHSHKLIKNTKQAVSQLKKTIYQFLKNKL